MALSGSLSMATMSLWQTIFVLVTLSKASIMEEWWRTIPNIKRDLVSWCCKKTETEIRFTSYGVFPKDIQSQLLWLLPIGQTPTNGRMDL